MILQQKRHLCLFAAAWLFGTVLYCRKTDVWLPVLCLLGGILIYGIMTGKRKGERMVVCGIVLALALTAFSVCGRQTIRDQRIQEILETDPGTVLSGTVISKQFRSNQYLYYLKTPYKKVMVYYDTDAISIGSAVTVHGNWQAFSHATNEGSFDYAEDCREQNISFRVFADAVEVDREPAVLFREGLYQLQKRITTVFSESLNAGEAGVLAALTVGNKGIMDPEVKEMYQDAGISHILAISGLHISILGYGVYRFLKKLRIPCHLCEGIGCGLILCFVIMSGMSVSAVRALIMYLLLMGAHASGRTYDPLNALALSMLVLLIPDPLTLYRSGFLFSFAAMTSIVLFGLLSEKHARVCEKQGRLASGAFLQMSLLPLTAWFYYEVPMYATFLNLLILPLCSALLGFGLAGGLLGIFFPQAAKWLLIPCHFILRFYEGSASLVNRLPLSTWITGQPSAWLIFSFYVSFFGVCFLIFLPRKEVRAGNTASLKHIGETMTRFAKAHMPICSLLPLILLSCILFVPERQICRIDFLDVGQGDGIFLTDGAGTRVMIDGGSSSESSVGAYEIEPFLKYHGIRKIDAWILTHGDSDHYSGLLEILEDGYRVEYLVLAETMPHDETWEKLVYAAEENGTEVAYVNAGDQIVLKDCVMTCLYPAPEDAEKENADEANELSQVWLFQKGDLSALFTGDLGEAQEGILLERGVLSDCVLLKVAHHGSKYSSCEEFLEAVSPEYAVISCAAKNIYGHPAPETLDRLSDAGCEVYQTPQCGQITFYEKRGKWKLRRFLFRKTGRLKNR